MCYRLNNSCFYIVQSDDFVCATRQLEAIRHNEISHSLIGNLDYLFSIIASLRVFLQGPKGEQYNNTRGSRRYVRGRVDDAFGLACGDILLVLATSRPPKNHNAYTYLENTTEDYHGLGTNLC